MTPVWMTLSLLQVAIHIDEEDPGVASCEGVANFVEVRPVLSSR